LRPAPSLLGREKERKEKIQEGFSMPVVRALRRKARGPRTCVPPVSRSGENLSRSVDPYTLYIGFWRKKLSAPLEFFLTYFV
jgi:hypothetical protein